MFPLKKGTLLPVAGERGGAALPPHTRGTQIGYPVCRVNYGSNVLVVVELTATKNSFIFDCDFFVCAVDKMD